LVAANGINRDNKNVEDCVKLIHEKNMSLLYNKNNNGDTPLRCAARAGKRHLVSYLIGLAKDNDKVQDLLRPALHEAIRRGGKEMVKELLRADPELTFSPQMALHCT
jgi:ankyrin repeat protein